MQPWLAGAQQRVESRDKDRQRVVVVADAVCVEIVCFVRLFSMCVCNSGLDSADTGSTPSRRRQRVRPFLLIAIV